jgi:hypothetical protein
MLFRCSTGNSYFILPRPKSSDDNDAVGEEKRRAYRRLRRKQTVAQVKGSGCCGWSKRPNARYPIVMLGYAGTVIVPD